MVAIAHSNAGPAWTQDGGAQGFVRQPRSRGAPGSTPMDTQVAPAVSTEEETYRLRTPASRRFFAEAREYLPGGDSRSTLFYRPYPAVMDRGEGCWLYDIDGNRLLDMTGNHSSLIHGYGHPAIVSAVQDQL